jgi:hypothetical protein
LLALAVPASATKRAAVNRVDFIAYFSFGEDTVDGDPDDGERSLLALSCDLEVLSVFRHGMRNFKLACSTRCKGRSLPTLSGPNFMHWPAISPASCGR